MGCHFLLQGIFPTQELNLDLPHCRQILYQLSYKGSPDRPCRPAQTPVDLCKEITQMGVELEQSWNPHWRYSWGSTRS